MRVLKSTHVIKRVAVDYLDDMKATELNIFFCGQVTYQANSTDAMIIIQRMIAIMIIRTKETKHLLYSNILPYHHGKNF